MNNRPVCGCSLETLSHPIDISNKNLQDNGTYPRVIQAQNFYITGTVMAFGTSCKRASVMPFILGLTGTKV
jgi:hypothetical protein